MPDLKELYVNGKSYCFKDPDDTEVITPIAKTKKDFTFEPSMEDFKLTELNFTEFPAIQQIPTSFNNVRLILLNAKYS